jgi:hypothetical protein
VLSDHETLDEIIERVTVDAYGNEGYSAFAQAFEDEVDFPLDATLAGVAIQFRSVDFDGDERRGLVAVIGRAGGTHRVSLLHLWVPTGPARWLIHAYKRWLGIA